MDHFVGHFGPYEVVEPLPCTMTWNEIVRIHVFEGRNDLPNVLVAQRWHDVKPPITACTFWMPEAACACLIVLITPR